MKFSAKPAEGSKSYFCFSASSNSRSIIRQIMRLSLITAILTTVTVQILFASNIKAQGSAQVEVTMELKNEPVLSAIRKIEQQTNFRFIYRNSDIKDIKNLNIPLGTRSVKATLNLILRTNGLTFSEVNNKILIAKTESYIIPAELADVRVMGVVLDDEGRPLPGVTIMIKGDRSSSAATDLNGHFNITIPSDGNQVLVFSYIGFKTQEIAVGSLTSLKVTMTPAPGSLQEVVVLGYSEQKKGNITGSVATVSGAELRQSASANVSNSLVGRLPGLIAFQGSGQPGKDDSRLLIRGISTFNNASPLIVVDGIPQEAVDSKGVNVAQSNMPHLDPADIESISILKDAGTSAVYGARAANGVILITTKRGEKGLPSLNYSFNGGWQKPTKLADAVDSYQYATLLNEMYKNENNFLPSANRGYTDAQLEEIRTGANPDKYGNTDWYDALMKPSSFQQRHNISVNGGGEKSRYFISTGYLDQGGVYTSSGYKQYSLRTNLDADISKNLKVSLNLNGRKEKTEDVLPGANPVNAYRSISPLYVSQFSNGTYNYISIPSGFTSLINGSPFLMANGEGGYARTDLNVLESVGSLIYTVPFLKGLTAKGTFSYNKYNTFYKTFNKPYTTYIRNDNGSFTAKVAGNNGKASLTQTYNDRQTILAEASLNYKATFGKHAVDALALYTQTQNDGNYMLVNRNNFPSPQIDQIFAGDPLSASTDGSAFRNARQSVVGRLAYNYEGKYLAEFSFRYDGSDVFPPKHRFGFFPSVSAGWLLSEESFLKGNSVVNFLKLRGSYGRLGNDKAGAFQYLNSYSLSGPNNYYTFGNVDYQALVPGVIPNAVFSWEVASLANIGVEAKLFGDKLGIEADVFQKRTSKILVNRSFQIPSTVGGGLPVENIGTMDNKGIEIALNHQSEIGQVRYSIKPNITFNSNKVISRPEAQGTLPEQSVVGHPFSLLSGTNLSNLGYIADGLYQSASEISSGPTPLYTNVAPGDIRYKDMNGDGKITPADRRIIGKGDYPSVIYGLSLSASYKGFDLNILMQGAAKVEKYMVGHGEWAFAGTSVPLEKHLDRWTPDHPNASYPRLFQSNLNNQAISTYWLRNGSYMRVKNIELAYNVPSAVLTPLKVSGVRVLVSGSNLFTFTKLKDVDPEALSGGFGASSYLIQKLFNVGLNVKF